MGKVLKSFNTCNISGFHILALKALLYPVYGLELRLHKQNQKTLPIHASAHTHRTVNSNTLAVIMPWKGTARDKVTINGVLEAGLCRKLHEW